MAERIFTPVCHTPYSSCAHKLARRCFCREGSDCSWVESLDNEPDTQRKLKSRDRENAYSRPEKYSGVFEGFWAPPFLTGKEAGFGGVSVRRRDTPTPPNLGIYHGNSQRAWFCSAGKPCSYDKMNSTLLIFWSKCKHLKASPLE